jgi:hypothetical protein
MPGKRALLWSIPVVVLIAGVAAALVLGQDDDRLVPTVWHSKSVSSDGRTIELRAAGGGCQIEVKRVDVEESAEQVAIEVFVQDPRGKACNTMFVNLPGVARLREPLGTRPLVGECTPSEDTVVGRTCSALTGQGS